MQTFARPTSVIANLVLPIPSPTLGEESFVVTVNGNYFSPSSTITVDGLPYAPSYDLSDLGHSQINYTTSATSLSNAGIYYISPSIDPLDPNDLDDAYFLQNFNYEFIDGLLTIDKLPLNIVPKNLSLVYGDKIENLQFDYNYDHSNISLNNEVIVLHLIVMQLIL